MAENVNTSQPLKRKTQNSTNSVYVTPHTLLEEITPDYILQIGLTGPTYKDNTRVCKLNSKQQLNRTWGVSLFHIPFWADLALASKRERRSTSLKNKTWEKWANKKVSVEPLDYIQNKIISWYHTMWTFQINQACKMPLKSISSLYTLTLKQKYYRISHKLLNFETSLHNFTITVTD